MVNVKEQFFQKLKEEYQQFRQRILQKDKQDIIKDSYRIEIFEELYKILVEKGDTLSDAILRNLLYQSGILDFLYDCWLKKEDSQLQELMDCVEEELGKAEQRENEEWRGAWEYEGDSFTSCE